MDWEVEPNVGSRSHYDQSRACSRCQAIMPPCVLEDEGTYKRFIMGLRGDLFSTYLAAPALEIFPGCSVAEWELVLSSSERPAQSMWANWKMPPMRLGFVTAGCPVIYGMNDMLLGQNWSTNWGYPLDEKHMDRLYTRIMLRQLSQHAQNALVHAPWKHSIPWVCRYCPDSDNGPAPILSRGRYREILRHVWLRGAESMQIFNEPRPTHPTIAVEEIQDAVAIYDEMLPYRQFLDRGTVMNTDVPQVVDDGAIWSGLLLNNEAVVRAFTQGEKPVDFSIRPWPNARPAKLRAPPGGQTYRLLLREGTVKVAEEHE